MEHDDGEDRRAAIADRSAAETLIIDVSSFDGPLDLLLALRRISVLEPAR